MIFDDFNSNQNSQELERTSLTADELFDGGKIRPLKPPPLSLRGNAESATGKSPVRSPRSHGRNIIRGAFSPRQKKVVDPFETAVENTRKRTEQERGRERVSALSSSSRRATRSLSPFRVSDYLYEEEQQQQQQQQLQQQNTKSSIISKASLSSTTSTLSTKSCRKWKLKDFFLFRSASEGRASDKDPLKKYTALFRKHEDVKNASFRSIEGSNSGSSSKRRGPVSAHELHYTMNKAVSEDLKRKTFLPYKQGILGRLAFNPAVNALANGFGLSRR
ncbi:hypothetical protein F0562_027300 [Nyssa sinensis]|uniref:Uncharacterized protein n=1 Tax=Nyssa sinensis TaxID=561372 RepID=A0A5J5B518_9ASTE|nr:hypothetical protein F0562_027300 [Nyssa sinensis]